MSKTIAKSRTVLSLIGLATALAVGATSTQANAGPAPPPPPPAISAVKIVEYSPGQLLVQLLISGVSTNFIAQQNAVAGCSVGDQKNFNRTIDTIKIWASLTQAALLAGKQVQIYYDVCGGNNYIMTIDLFQ